MPMANIRDAAIQSHFASRAALTAWLSRAVGEHWVHLERALYHTHQALRLCPLEGRSYVYLADLSFLWGADAKAKQTCIEQAVRVRPHEGACCTPPEARPYGRRCRRWLEYSSWLFAGRRQQDRLMGDLVANTPQENLPVLIDFIIREFQPDLWDLQSCTRLVRTAVLRNSCVPSQRRAEQRNARLDPQGHGKPRKSGRSPTASQPTRPGCGNAGLARNAVPMRFGQLRCPPPACILFVEQRLFAEAESQWRWCLQRTPNNPVIETRLRETLKGRLDSQPRAAAENERS